MCKYTARIVSPHASPTDLPPLQYFERGGQRRQACGEGRLSRVRGARERSLVACPPATAVSCLACTRPRAVGAEELELLSRQHLVGHDEQQLYFETSSGDTYSLRPCSTNLSPCCPPCGRFEGSETLSSLCLRPELGN